MRFRLFSKETGFLLLNGLLTIATCAVVLGTFYPMIFTAMSWGSISVGAPYFNSIFAPLAVFLMLAMGLAVILRWKQIPLKTILLKLAFLPIALGLAVGLIQHTIAQTQLYQFELLPLLFVTLAMWII
ncbi:cytochrome c-type biogenesis protein [Actinobacillus equuli]|nr:cytochrome c-type biogenesis protein [Actinobacillus equuli]